MENYKGLAIQYLRLNKRRTILTILGTSLTVLILYVMLNGLFCYLDYTKEDYINTYGDYEMIFYTETAEQIARIKEDPVVKAAYVGRYYEYREEKTYENALYIKGDSPYHIDKNFEYLARTYGIDGEVDEYIAAFSLQGSDATLIYILIIFLLLVAYIFAIFGVGVIRNSIQLSLFEQIKDYGNLRCIGASKGQLRAVIFTQGAIMETFGIIIGIIVGQLGMSLFSVFISKKLSMHLIPVVLILIAYYGDLYFAMEENCKLVTGMSPVSALRGEFRIRKEKIKIRKRSIFGKIFGIEGDYAYKSLMRSPGKFYKSVGAMLLGIIALIACFGSMKLFDVYIDDFVDMSGYYQHYYRYVPELGEKIDVAQKNLPEVEFLQKVARYEKVTDVSKIYQAEALLVDDDELKTHLTKEYLSKDPMKTMYSKEQEGSDSENLWKYIQSKIQIYGYSGEDYARYEDYLVDGTLDVSENGIVIVNGTKTMVEVENVLEYETIYTSKVEELTITDYKIGDTIDIVNPEKLATMVAEEMDGIWGTEEYSFLDRGNQIEKCKQELIQNGEYKTYVIEGILERDANLENADFSIVLPLDRYFAMTGQNENSVIGMAYHIDGNISMKDIEQLTYDSEEKGYYTSYYLDMIGVISEMKKYAIYALIFMLFIATVSSVNIINTTASNIQLRRKEFAQLRVIGVSKRRLMRMVMLEGVIMVIVANILGFIVGNAFNYGIYWFMRMLWDVDYTIPWLGMFFGLLLSVAVLCGSIYAPLISMKQTMAEDLMASGE